MASLRLPSSRSGRSSSSRIRLRSSHRPAVALRSSHRRTAGDWEVPDKDRDTPWEPTPATGKRARKNGKRKKRR